MKPEAERFVFIVTVEALFISDRFCLEVLFSIYKWVIEKSKDSFLDDTRD